MCNGVRDSNSADDGSENGRRDNGGMDDHSTGNGTANVSASKTNDAGRGDGSGAADKATVKKGRKHPDNVLILHL